MANAFRCEGKAVPDESNGFVIRFTMAKLREEQRIGSALLTRPFSLFTIVLFILILNLSQTASGQTRSLPFGSLTQLPILAGCVSEDGNNGCLRGRGLTAATSVALSPDGKNLYVASPERDYSGAKSGGLSIFSRDTISGALTQLTGGQGCVNMTGREGCAVARGLRDPVSVAVSPDGRNVYAVSRQLGKGTLSAFTRDPESGTLTQLAANQGCISEAGADGCANGRGMEGAASVTVGPDGKNAYVAAASGHSLAIFNRNGGGSLTQPEGGAGCVKETSNPTTNEGCAYGRALRGATSVTTSLDGQNIYVASYLSSAVAVFDRDAKSGLLTQPAGQEGCVGEVEHGCAGGRALEGALSATVSRNGKSVYVASWGSNAVAIFDRNTTNGDLKQLEGRQGCVSEDGIDGCGRGRGLGGLRAVTVSADGKHVYASAYDSGTLSTFKRDIDRGTIKQLEGSDGCMNEVGSEGCAKGRRMVGAVSAEASLDGRNVYLASYDGNGLSIFTRDLATGVLAQLDGSQGCVSENQDGGCALGRGLNDARPAAVSPDGTSVYVGSEEALAIFRRTPGDGTLAQPDGNEGCISSSGIEGCAVGRSLGEPASVTVSPDGKNVYVASALGYNNLGALAIFKRNPGTGALEQLDGDEGCINSDSSGGCDKARGVDNPISVATSPDGKTVYVASFIAPDYPEGMKSWGALVIFKRDPTTGALTQLKGKKGCVNKDGTQGCTVARGLDGQSSVAVSPDSRNVYLTYLDVFMKTPDPGALATFRRDRSTGAVRQLDGKDGCISEDGSGGTCRRGRGLRFATSVAINPNGSNVYTGARGAAIASFSRNRETGTLTQLEGKKGCMGDTQMKQRDGCSLSRSVSGVSSVGVSPDGKSFYSASYTQKGLGQGGAVSVFALDSTDGSLRQLQGSAGCLSYIDGDPSCSLVAGIQGLNSLVISPDNKNLYTTAGRRTTAGRSHAVGVFRRNTG